MAGMGVARIASFIAAPALLDGRLKRVLADWQAPAIPIQLVYLPNQRLSPRIRVFIDAMTQALPTTLAWNDADTARYAKLLTSDCDIVSATGRVSQGRQAVIDLYVDQRRVPIYAQAKVTATLIDKIRLLGEHVALVDARYRMTGVHWNSDETPFELEGKMLFVMQRQEQWKIASIRAQSPEVSPQKD